jgi:hypothetical protein
MFFRILFGLLFFTSTAFAAYINEVSIVDNSNNNTAAVKGASESPTVSDKALVVSLSPNASLPLPSGGATAAKQDISNGYLLSIDGKLTSPLSVAQSGTWDVNNILGTITLPTGAATSANQATANASLNSIDSKIPANLTVSSTRLLVDGSGVTQPISAASLPLPSGAATAANQTTANASLSSIDGKIVAVNTGAVVVSSSALPSGAATSANQTTIIGHVDGIETLLTSISGFVDGVETILTNIYNLLTSGISTFADKSSISASLTALNDAVTLSSNGTSTWGVQITGTWVGVVSFQGTKDGTNWYSIVCFPHSGTGTNVTSTSGNTQVMCPVGNSTQVRAIRTTATSGTAVVSIVASAGPSVMQVYQLNANSLLTAASQTGTWTVQPGNTPNTTPWYVQNKGSYNRIVTATTTTVKSGAGVLKRLCIGTLVNGTSITVYDNTTNAAPIISIIAPPNGSVPGCMDYDAVFSTGLTIVTNTTTDLTVVYE